MAYKIQMIAPTSFFADTGCHVRILEEIWSLQEAGHEVTVCTYHTGDAVNGVKIKRSMDVPWRKGVQVGSSRHKLYFDAMLALRSWQTAWQQKPDIIHAHIHEGALIGYATRWLGRAGKAPLVFDFQGSLTGEMVDHHFLRADGPFYQPTLALEKLINRLPDQIITSSHNARRILLDQFGVKPEKVTTVSDRVNYERFRPSRSIEEAEDVARLRQELGIPADRKVVVYLGLLAEYQGINVLLEAARLVKTEMPEAFFVIMGYPGVDRYARLAAEYGLSDSVIFPGRIPYQEAPRYLRLGDVAVAPKMSATEGAGKIPNYMAMALPVVAFDTPISRELMGDMGVYAERGNPRSLADCLKELLSDPARCAEIGHNLRRKAVRELGMNHTRYELEAVYAEVLARRAPAAMPQPQPQLALGAAADSGGATHQIEIEPSRAWYGLPVADGGSDAPRPRSTAAADGGAPELPSEDTFTWTELEV